MDAAKQPLSWSLILRSYPARLTLYAVVIFLIYQALYLGVRDHGPASFSAENGPVEFAQAVLAMMTAIALFYAASCCRRGRAGTIACAAMVACAAAREADSTFESLFFEDAYRWLVGFPMLLVASLALWIDRRRVVEEALWLVRQPSVTMFALAGIYLCGFCQILDRPALWQGTGFQGEANATKAMIEELAELFAYLLLFASGIEGIILAHSTSQQDAAELESDDARHLLPLATVPQERRRAA